MIPSLPLENGRPTATQIAQYWNDGFLFPLPVIPQALAARWRTEFEQMEADWLTADLPLPLNIYKRINAQCVMPLASQIGTHPAILDAVEAILGPDILIYGVEFFVKEPHTKALVAMHQDLTYWGMGAIDGLLTAWVPLSPATPASGCMDFVAGSHKQAILPHEDRDDANNLLSRGQEVAVDIADEDKVAIELHPGQMSLHHGLTVHGSGPNVSDDRRIAAVIRYLTPDVAQEHGGGDYAIPVRGSDTKGNFIHYQPATDWFTPDDLARHDEIRAHQAKVTMAGAAEKGLYAARNK
ncbi:Phytanoyl-CoA dioxygenase (PhyH) [Shimia gijangensis]|uniref:Phytanoyl-CoA dioxygenase (PhyH) n=1 Tax=Shimia gijangensis TaxID=1470563 RepID=A0A1M6GZV6_9RHOB|nr:phytanoyl-CoA dioxygenase family protein [Shimia gijangensis]SHJ15466.1 Phytanoyl-CoA dioxygenase (PhyH) [Shimia gijangensis]